MAMYPTAGATPYDAVRTLSAEALLQELRSDVALTLLDVREHSELHETGTLTGAWAIPLRQLTARIEELVHLRMTPLVLVSQTGRRARTAALQLELAGFEEVSVLEGGLRRWLDLGYPVEGRRESSRP